MRLKFMNKKKWREIQKGNADYRKWERKKAAAKKAVAEALMFDSDSSPSQVPGQQEQEPTHRARMCFIRAAMAKLSLPQPPETNYDVVLRPRKTTSVIPEGATVGDVARLAEEAVVTALVESRGGKDDTDLDKPNGKFAKKNPAYKADLKKELRRKDANNSHSSASNPIAKALAWNDAIAAHNGDPRFADWAQNYHPKIVKAVRTEFKKRLG